MRNWLTLIGLTLAVGALAAWLFLKPADPSEAGYALSSLKAAEVTRLKLGRKAAGGAQELALEKRDGVWRIVAPFSARGDAYALERLLTILDARTAVRYPAADLARYGLETPAMVLTMNDQSIAYGSINPTTREQYVLSGGYVYVVALNYAATLPRDVNALLSKELFGPDEKSPARFDLPGYTVALEEGTWAVAPIANEASADERNAWVDAWRNAAALTVKRDESLSTAAQSTVTRDESPSTAAQSTVKRDELLSTATQLKVTLKDGRTIGLRLAEREPDVVLVREDEGVAYHFFADAGKRLLAPPGAAAVERSHK